MEVDLRKSNVFSSLVLGLAIAVGMVVMGYFISEGVTKFKKTERVITVRGLAEREVKADLVIWPISFINVGNDLVEMQKKIFEDKSAIKKYLIDNGIKETDINDMPPEITDHRANNYAPERSSLFRYAAQSVVVVRTDQVDLSIKLMGSIDELFNKGIVFNKNYEQKPVFLFTGLNGIKPEMISKAIQVARETAELFAKDSKAKVGAIRSARQGYFEINDRDANTPNIKIVRVVISVDYFIE